MGQKRGFINVSTNILSPTGQTKKRHCGLDPQSLEKQEILKQVQHDENN